MSFEAILNETLTSSFMIKNLPTEEIRKNKYICPECKDEMIFIKEYKRELGIWRSHFAHKNNEKCDGYIPKGESKEHYNKKMNLLDILYNNTIYFNIANMQWKFDKNLVKKITPEKEVLLEKGLRRADILIEFIQPQYFLGWGIAVEIIESETNESIKMKEYDYALNMISVAKSYDGEEIEITTPYPIALHYYFENYKKELQQYEEKIKYLHKDFFIKAIEKGWNCLNCRYSSKNNKDKESESICCWKDWDKSKSKIIKMKPKIKYDFAPCEYYEKISSCESYKRVVNND